MSWLSCDLFPVTTGKLYLTLWMCGKGCKGTHIACGKDFILTTESRVQALTCPA